MRSSDSGTTCVLWVVSDVHAVPASQTLFFGISADADGTCLLEEYIFEFSYAKQGGGSFALAASGGKGFSSKAARGQVMPAPEPFTKASRPSAHTTDLAMHDSMLCCDPSRIVTAPVAAAGRREQRQVPGGTPHAHAGPDLPDPGVRAAGGALSPATFPWK